MLFVLMRDQPGIKPFMLSYNEEPPKTVPNSLGVLQRLNATPNRCSFWEFVPPGESDQASLAGFGFVRGSGCGGSGRGEKAAVQK